MPRPARPQWVQRSYARRRHRTWMKSMTLATVGWGAWWIALVIKRLAPEYAPGFWVVASFASVFALFGLAGALLTLRAQRSWLMCALGAVFANTSRLLLPWVVSGLELGGRD